MFKVLFKKEKYRAGVAVMVASAFLLSTGCIAPGYHAKKLKQEYDKGYSEADSECLTLQKSFIRAYKKVEHELGEKNERLKKFNQLDKEGNLRKATGSFHNPKGYQPKGTEVWQK